MDAEGTCTVVAGDFCAEGSRWDVEAASEQTHNKNLEVVALDPEQNKAAVEVGIAAIARLTPYRLPNPIKDLQDAIATGRVEIYCIDLMGSF